MEQNELIHRLSIVSGSISNLFNRKEGRLVIWIITVLILALLSLTVIPLNIIGGLGLAIIWGALLRSIFLSKTDKVKRTDERILDFTVESFGLSLVTLSPMVFILPAILGTVDYWLVVILGCFILSIIDVAKFERNTSSIIETFPDTENQSDRNNLILMIVFILVSIVFGVLFYIRVTYYSFDGLTFFIKDVALHISIIQSMSHGYWPIPDLLETNATINNNPVMMTLGFAFSGVLMSLTHLGNSGDVFLIFVNTLFRGYVLLTFFWFMKRFSSKVPSWIIVVGGLAFAFGTDIASLIWIFGFYPWTRYQGIPFPRTLVDGTVSGVSVSSLGTDSIFLAFHHLPAVIVFMLLLGFLKQRNNFSTKYLLPALMLVVIPFYHLGIGLMLAAPIIIALVIQGIRKILPDLNKKYILIIAKAFVVFSIVVLYILRDLTKSIIILIPRVQFWTVIPALIAYFGFFTLLLPLGYYLIHKEDLDLTNLILICATDSLAVMMIFFSTARDLHTGYVTADYYPLMAFQAVGIVTALVGLRKGIPSLKVPFDIKGKQIRIDNRTIKFSAVVGMIVVSSLTMTMFWSANYGVFHLSHYGDVPLATHAEYLAYDWIYQNSVPTDVILIHPLNWEICPIIGRQIISSGYRIDESNDFYKNVTAMFNSTTIGPVLDLFVQHDVRYVFISDLERDSFPLGISKFETSEYFLKVYSENGIDIFEFLGASI